MPFSAKRTYGILPSSGSDYKDRCEPCALPLAASTHHKRLPELTFVNNAPCHNAALCNVETKTLTSVNCYHCGDPCTDEHRVHERPTPTLGGMMLEGMNVLHEAWWLTVMPGVAIFTFVLALNVIGDRLRDAVDPRLKDV